MPEYLIVKNSFTSAKALSIAILSTVSIIISIIVSDYFSVVFSILICISFWMNFYIGKTQTRTSLSRGMSFLSGILIAKIVVFSTLFAFLCIIALIGLLASKNSDYDVILGFAINIGLFFMIGLTVFYIVFYVMLWQFTDSLKDILKCKSDKLFVPQKAIYILFILPCVSALILTLTHNSDVDYGYSLSFLSITSLLINYALYILYALYIIELRDKFTYYTNNK